MSPVRRAAAASASASLTAATMSAGSAAERPAQNATSSRTWASSTAGSNCAPGGASSGSAARGASRSGSSRPAVPAGDTVAVSCVAMANTTAPATASSGTRVGGRERRTVIERRSWLAQVQVGGAGTRREGSATGRWHSRRTPVRSGEVGEGGPECPVVRVHAVAGRDREVRQQGELGVDDVVSQPAAVEGEGSERRSGREPRAAAEGERELVREQDGRDRGDLVLG